MPQGIVKSQVCSVEGTSPHCSCKEGQEYSQKHEFQSQEKCLSEQLW